MRQVLSLFSVLFLALLIGSQLYTKTMALLDEDIAEVNLSKSNGFEGMNEDIIHSFSDEESIKVFEKAITTARKQIRKVDVSEPEYNVMISYAPDGFPTHAIHLWLGKEDEKSMFMYLGDDEAYLTTKKITKKLRMLIPKE